MRFVTCRKIEMMDFHGNTDPPFDLRWSIFWRLYASKSSDFAFHNSNSNFHCGISPRGWGEDRANSDLPKIIVIAYHEYVKIPCILNSKPILKQSMHLINQTKSFLNWGETSPTSREYAEIYETRGMWSVTELTNKKRLSKQVWNVFNDRCELNSRISGTRHNCAWKSLINQPENRILSSNKKWFVVLCDNICVVYFSISKC
jgi:hypothetical protein